MAKRFYNQGAAYDQEETVQSVSEGDSPAEPPPGEEEDGDQRGRRQVEQEPDEVERLEAGNDEVTGPIKGEDGDRGPEEQGFLRRGRHGFSRHGSPRSRILGHRPRGDGRRRAVCNSPTSSRDFGTCRPRTDRCLPNAFVAFREAVAYTA